jgi:hypothetical protein
VYIALKIARGIEEYTKSYKHKHHIIKEIEYPCSLGFGGLEDVCSPPVHKFAGSNPAETVGFFRAKKIPSTPSSGSSKAGGPMT